tara:strand:- start:147 stop:536 length:390 start_codon:yes stop_codon:yes gene_type:complete
MPKERDQSEFSGDINYLDRLNALLNACNVYSINLDVYNWYHSLNALFRELSTEMQETEKNNEIEQGNTRIKSLRETVGLYLRRKQKKGINEIKPELYDELHEFDLFLRRILKKSGLQLRLKEYAGSALQ